MSMTTCKKCGASTSPSAKTCPSCGAKLKKSLLMKLLLGFFAIGLIGTVLSVATNQGKPNSAPTAKKPTMSSIAAGCQVEWEMQLKSKLKNPSSLEWDVQGAALGMYKEKASVLVPYRATNSFGALTADQAICQIDAETGAVKAILK